MLFSVVAVGLAIGQADSGEEAGKTAKVDVAALRQERLKLLEDRVALIAAGGDVTVRINGKIVPGKVITAGSGTGLVEDAAAAPAVTAERIYAEIGLIRARTDYARTAAEKKKSLAELVQKYNILVDSAHEALQAPAGIPAAAGGRGATSTPGAELLFLKSERLRVQIELAELD